MCMHILISPQQSPIKNFFHEIDRVRVCVCVRERESKSNHLKVLIQVGILGLKMILKSAHNKKMEIALKYV